MATLLSALITQVRDHLVEPTANFWSDAELVRLLDKGAKDLWKAINDVYGDHFVVIDETNVVMPANSFVLTGIPTNVFRVSLIEPRNLDPGAGGSSLAFRPKDYTHPDFQMARAASAVTPDGALVILYDVLEAGAPVGAPVIRVAPKVSTALNLSLVYTPTLTTLTAVGDTNPIPGESDQALIAWTIAYARAKEREDRSPDPEWLAIYATEKQQTLTAITPRQIQEPDTAEAVFETYWT